MYFVLLNILCEDSKAFDLGTAAAREWRLTGWEYCGPHYITAQTAEPTSVKEIGEDD